MRNQVPESEKGTENQGNEKTFLSPPTPRPPHTHYSSPASFPGRKKIPSPSSDKHQFSPNDIHTFSRDKVMRNNEMITKEKML